MIRRNESNVISRHELTFQTSTIFSSKKQFLNQNIDDEREQNQLKKLNDDDIDARVEKKNFKKIIQKKFYRFYLQMNFEIKCFKYAIFFDRFLFFI